MFVKSEMLKGMKLIGVAQVWGSIQVQILRSWKRMFCVRRLSLTKNIEIGRQLKIIIDEYGLNIHAFAENMKDALKAYEHYGKNMNMEEIDWRGWQKDLRQYLNYVPCGRKVI